jgi:protein TonB
MSPRLRHQKGPALHGGPLPVTATVLSLLTHAVIGAAIVVAATQWSTRQTKTYVVNLVPAVAAVGRPEGRPALPPRTEEAPPRPAPKTAELPERERPRPAPAPPPELPTRAPSLPDRALPERTLPPRAPGAPRPSEKELPQVASTTTPTPSPSAVTTPAPRPVETPTPSLGQRSGSAQGSGPVTVTASDFPFAWYISAIQRKIAERWETRAQPGRQPVAVFAIGRDGRISGLAIEKTSGNSYYDQAALRSISEALPFPPLPAEFPEPVLTIHLGFNFAQDRG